MTSDLLSKSTLGLLSRPKKERHENHPRSVSVDGENDNADSDGKVKTKLMSFWNNMKYGWTVKLKTNFSKDSPVWLLGNCYHRKIDNTQEYSSCHDRNTRSEEEGIEGFKLDFISRIWLTYRREFPLMNGSNFTTDCGWGCMLRSGQMLLAQALVYHFLGRDWRWRPEQDNGTSKQYLLHRKLIKWFGDSPSCYSPLSIHTLVSLGEACGKKAGDWYGPGSVAHLLRKAVDQASHDIDELNQLCVYVAQDCAVYIQDIMDQCNWKEGGRICQEVPSKSLIILVPLRLGAEKTNSIYGHCLTSLLTLENCIGIIGGRPKHSLYFIGFQDDKLIHLDPHYCQEMVDVWQPNFPLYSFHCRSPRKMNLSKLDPSCCIGFYCRSLDDMTKFIECVQEYLIPASEKAEYPMFVFCDGHSRDAVRVPQYSIPDYANRFDNAQCQDSEDELECEEFEIV